MVNTEERVVVELCKRDMDLPLLQNLLNTNRLVAHRAIQIARGHNLATYVLDRLIKIPIDFAGKDQLIPAARREILFVTSTNLTFRRELHRICSALTVHGIDCVLLRGLSLDFTGLRVMGDLDILVAQDMIVPAIRAILTIPGYRFSLVRDTNHRPVRMISKDLSASSARRVVEQASWNSEYHLYHDDYGILLELHTRLVYAPADGYSSASKELAKFQQNVNYFWDRRVFDPLLKCFTLLPEHSLILMCIQTAFKRSPAGNNFRLANLLDIDQLAARGVDWNEVVYACRRFDVAHMVLFSLSLAKRFLDTPVSEHIFSELEARCLWSRRLAIDLHLKSMQSITQRSSASSKLSILLTSFISSDNARDKIRWVLLIPVLFPARWRMAQLFGVSQTSSLLPFAYLVNPIRWLWLLLGRLFRR